MKKFTSLVLAVCVLAALLVPFAVSPVAAIDESGVRTKYNAIMSQYPAGSYFSANGQACSHGSQGTCNNCKLSYVLSANGAGWSASEFDAWTCAAFARYVYYSLFGVALKQSSITSGQAYVLKEGSISNYKTILENAMIGDAIRLYTGSDASGTPSHYVIYGGSFSSSGFLCYHSNWGGTNKVAHCEITPSSKYNYIEVIRASNYVRCDHSSNYDRFDEKGICTNCQYQFPYDNGRDISCAGTYKVKSGATAYIRKGPYQGCDEVTHVTSGKFTVTARVLNCKGNYWYELSYNGDKCYVVAKNLEFVEHIHCLGTYYEGAHPHKEYTQCSDCGATSYTGNTKKVSGCETCYPPAAIDITNPSTYPAYPGATLRNGSSGNAVRFVQMALNDLGYNCGSVDGVYGTNTTNAVAAFQSAHGLTSDGLCGQWTYAEIVSVLTVKYTATSVGVPTITASSYGTNVTVNWSAVNNATSYDVYLIQSPWGWGDVMYSANLGAGTNICTFSNVAPGEYAAFVIARPNSDDSSAQSNWVALTVSPFADVPVLQSATSAGNQVSLSWSACANATHYDVYLLYGGNGWEHLKYSASVSTNYHTFTGVDEGTYTAFVISRPNLDNVQSNWKNVTVSNRYGPLSYSVSNGQITITDCDPSVSDEIVIPAEIGGYPVTEIAGYAFEDCSLSFVSVPESVVKVGGAAFLNCSELTEIELSDGVKLIDSYAFQGCSQLVNISLPQGLETLGDSVFSGCSSLTEIVISDDNQNYATENGVLFTKDLTTLIRFPANSPMVEYQIPDGVVTIGQAAFIQCKQLISVIAPKSVSSFGLYAFKDVSADFVLCGYKDSATQAYAAENAIPFVAIEEEPEILTGTTGDCIWTLDGTVLTISGNGAMADYDWEKLAPWGREITSVVIENGVTNIGDYAFFGCTRLTAINIADSVTSIGGGAFFECTTLASVEIPDSVTSIGGEAFYGCTSLTSVTIPDGVTYIGFVAFDCCDNLTTISVSPSNTEYSSLDGVLFDKNQTTLICCPAEKVGSYTIPGSVINIEPRAFHNCDGLTSVTIPNSVNSIGGNAFWGCTGLTAVTLPNGITTLWYGTFNGCTGLTSVTIPGSVTSIDTGAFDGCENLTIYGYTGSAAETYAAENDIPFVALADVEGDIDGDGVVGIGDLTLFAQLISGWTTNDGCELFDYDGDGVCTIGDLTFLSKFLSGWEDAQTYQLIFDAAEGTCDLTGASAICGKEFGNLPTPKREGYEFVGWHTEDGTLIQSSDLAPIHFRPVILVAKWKENPVSDWVLASDVPEDTLIVDEKWTYDKTQWITSNSSSVSGYTLDSTKTTSAWGEYGNWSNWSNSAVSASDSRQVETQTIGATYKTQYNYSKYAQTSSGGGYSGPWAGTWGGIKCQYYTERGWTDSALSAYSSQTVSGTTFYLYGKSGDTWYNETTRQVVVTEAYTQYRYRDRALVYTYHLFKVEKNESEAEVVASDTVSNVQKWVRYRAK